MKIAFCFLTLDDVLHPQVWDAFFAAAPADSFNIYCHPKDPDAVKSRWLAPRVLRRLVPTRHAHVSLVAACLAMFADAYRHDRDNMYFVLLSESAMPIVPAQTIVDQLECLAPRSLVPWYAPLPGSEHHSRRHALVDGAVFPEPFFFHDQWIVLHRRHVTKLLQKSYLDVFEAVFAPEEHYILNVLVHAMDVPLDEFINRRTTFVNWRDCEVRVEPDPAMKERTLRTVRPKTYHALTASDLAAAQGAWFFRKVAADCDCRLALQRLGTSPVPQGV